jgi:hypothetical protein
VSSKGGRERRGEINHIIYYTNTNDVVAVAVSLKRCIVVAYIFEQNDEYKYQ